MGFKTTFGITAGLTLAFTGALVIYSAVAADKNSGQSGTAGGLSSPEAFSHISDKTAYSKAVFEELGKVIQHPRCVNCHAENMPLQGENFEIHQPRVERGEAGFGKPGMMCSTCHNADNLELAGDWAMPGHLPWKMAPIEQVWHNKSLSEICQQIKDPKRNGGMSHDELIHHVEKDGLVGWGWHPGSGREPAPGSQKIAGQLTRAWLESGAHCP